MSFLGNFFHTKKKDIESVVLIDISSGSVAGAYATFTKGEQPSLLYTRRLPVEAHAGEPQEQAMLRALQVLGSALVREGAPALQRATGSGSTDSILVSVDAPWQKTLVRTEYLEQDEPFIFTKSMAIATLEKTNDVPEGQIIADESIIGTILNGYETRDPYGKQANRAAILVLTSFVDEQVEESIRSVLRGLYHTEDILSIAGGSLRYQAIRIAFPHEHDALIIDATSAALTSFMLVRKGLLVKVDEVKEYTKNTAAWIRTTTDTLKEVAELFPLPRTIFLLAHEADIVSLREVLDEADLGKLWLSDNPPKIVSVLGSHIIGAIRQATAAPADLSLLLMALYFQYHGPEDVHF